MIKVFETLGTLGNGLNALGDEHEPLRAVVEFYGFNTKCPF
jgi:hypothetical protein